MTKIGWASRTTSVKIQILQLPNADNSITAASPRHVKRTFPKQQFLRIEILNFQASERYQNISRNGISWECNEWNLNVKKEFEKKRCLTSALCHSGQPNMTRCPSGDHRAETIKCLVPCPARDRHWELTLSSQTTKYVHVHERDLFYVCNTMSRYNRKGYGFRKFKHASNINIKGIKWLTNRK